MQLEEVPSLGQCSQDVVCVSNNTVITFFVTLVHKRDAGYIFVSRRSEWVSSNSGKI